MAFVPNLLANHNIIITSHKFIFLEAERHECRVLSMAARIYYVHQCASYVWKEMLKMMRLWILVKSSPKSRGLSCLQCHSASDAVVPPYLDREIHVPWSLSSLYTGWGIRWDRFGRASAALENFRPFQVWGSWGGLCSSVRKQSLRGALSSAQPWRPKKL